MIDEFDFACSVPVTFERGCTDRIGRLLKEEGFQSVLVAIDPNLEEISLTDTIFQSLEDEQITYQTYTDIEPNPKIRHIDRGAEAAKAIDADCVVAIGGGSAIDTAKGIALVATHSKSIHEFQRTESGDYITTDSEALPLYTVPTTVGTGSEVTTGIVVSDSDQNKKIVVGADGFSPTRALLDPSLLRTLPRDVISSTGMDSFTQAVESYIASGASPITEALSIRAIKMINKNIRPAIAKRDDESLEKMQIATTLGAIAFDNSGLGLVHGISHPVSAHYDTPHGITNAVLLPYVLEFNLIASVDKYDTMARTIGRASPDQPPRKNAETFVDTVRTLTDDLGIPARLSELGVEQEMLPTIAEETAVSGAPNPRAYDAEDVEKILKKAY